jgi:hypothetical protein
VVERVYSTGTDRRSQSSSQSETQNQQGQEQPASTTQTMADDDRTPTATPLAGTTTSLHLYPPPAANEQGGGDGGGHQFDGAHPHMQNNGDVYRLAFLGVDKDEQGAVRAEDRVMFDLPASAPPAARADPSACGGAPLYDAIQAVLPDVFEEGGLLHGLDPADCTLGAVRALIADGAVAVCLRPTPDMHLYWLVDLATGELVDEVPGWVPLRWGRPGGTCRVGGCDLCGVCPSGCALIEGQAPTLTFPHTPNNDRPGRAGHCGVSPGGETATGTACAHRGASGSGRGGRGRGHGGRDAPRPGGNVGGTRGSGERQ